MPQQRRDGSNATRRDDKTTAIQVVREKPILREIVQAWSRQGLRIGVVPTMGALHRGHLALLDRARMTCDRVVVSIFAGVATVVTKLLLQTGADQAFFGEKDYQQLQVIRRVALDLDIATEIIAVETVREADGLALSSRNAYLSTRERDIAARLPSVLREIAETATGHSVVLGSMLLAAKAKLLAAGFDSIDYLHVCDATTLRPVETVTGPARVLVAARLGKTRLIDNMPVIPQSGGTPGLA